VPRLGPDDPDAKRIDDALAEWRQGDVAVDADRFVHVADGAAPLTNEAAELEAGPSVIQTTVEGLVLLTQTCDIVRSCAGRPFVELAPLVEVSEEEAHRIERGHRPNYAIVAALRDRRLVADLDRVMTVEKSILVTWARLPGWSTDDEGRRFAQALARKRIRFAFPNDFNELVRKLQSRIDDKHDRLSDEGRALRALREIRVTASPSWDDPKGVTLFFWFLRNENEATFDGRTWDTWLDAWKKLVPATGRFASVEGVVVALRDMTAQEYQESDPLDLDYLSTRTS
jgi:hypothetical protein